MHDKALTLDEIANLAGSAAYAAGYPEDLAGIVAEMTVWLERHRLPGLKALAERLEQAPRFDEDSMKPELLESGRPVFHEPITSGMFIHENFRNVQFPMMYEGPETGTLLTIPFLALAAHEQGLALAIAFMDQHGNAGEAARLVYSNGKSALEGRTATTLTARVIGVEKIDALTIGLSETEEGPVLVDAELVARLTPSA